MIVCENLTRYYGSFAAVDRLSFRIERGAICAMVGPNGAGKTTTMRMLATLLPPTRGRAALGGRDIRTQRAGVRQLIGFLPETFQFYEDLSIERYLQFFARAYGLDSGTASSRIIDFLERLGLQDRRKHRIKTLSRGMRQRLGVARCFLHDPDVALLDEPASGLDPVARTELRDFLKYQQWMGKTMLVSSHILKELADFCDHVLIMQRGRLVECGPLHGAQGVLAKYAGRAREGRRYTLRVIKDAARLEVFLSGISGVSRIERRGAALAFELAGDEEAAARVLGRLTESGFLIVKFSPEEMDLEAVYRKAANGASEA